MSSWKRWLLWFLLVVILPMATYGVYVQWRVGTKTNPDIVKALIEPYAETLKSGDFTRAYQRFASSGFCKAHTLEQYIQAQQDNLIEFGSLSRISLKAADPFRSAYNLFSWRKYYQGGVAYHCGKAEVWVNWEVVLEDGAFKIDDTFQAFHQRLRPRIFWRLF